MSDSLRALLDNGQLNDAIDHLTKLVRSAPTDTAARSRLSELLCLSGAFERAETQLALVADQTVDRPVAIARMRHLIRAAVAREGWFNEGAVPALLGEPSLLQRLAIALALALREGAADEARTLLTELEARRVKPSGLADGVPFDDLRDADDRSAWFFEIMTQDGGYLWVDVGSIAALRFTPPTRPIDLLWREARVTFHDGRAADVVVPAQYVDPAAEPAHRLAQRTDWRAAPAGVTLGTGQRLFLVGDDARGLLDFTNITFHVPGDPSQAAE